MSYSKDSKATDHDTRVADFNHFVIFDPRNLLACHDFHYIDLQPDPKNESCHSSYINVTGHDATAKWALGGAGFRGRAGARWARRRGP
jgi:hypothetical protein